MKLLVAVLMSMFASLSIAAQIATIVADGTNVVHFVCEDENISADKLAVVSNDFARLLSSWGDNCRIRYRTNQISQTYRQLSITRPRGITRYCDGIPLWSAISGDAGVDQVVVPKELTDYYATNSIADAYASEIQKAFDFASMMITNPIVSMDRSAFGDIYLTRAFPPRNIPISDADEIIFGNFDGRSFYMPSLLSFGLAKYGPNTNESYLCSYIPTKKGNEPIFYIPIVYYDNQWWINAWIAEDFAPTW